MKAPGNDLLSSKCWEEGLLSLRMRVYLPAMHGTTSRGALSQEVGNTWLLDVTEHSLPRDFYL